VSTKENLTWAGGMATGIGVCCIAAVIIWWVHLLSYVAGYDAGRNNRPASSMYTGDPRTITEQPIVEGDEP